MGEPRPEHPSVPPPPHRVTRAGRRGSAIAGGQRSLPAPLLGVRSCKLPVFAGSILRPTSGAASERAQM